MIENEQVGIHGRGIRETRDDDLVFPLLPVELPRRFEELEKLLEQSLSPNRYTERRSSLPPFGWCV